MSQHKFWRLVATAMLALATATVTTPGAQTPAVQAPQEQPTDDQRPVIRRTFDLITTDAIVRDANGQFVADLRKEDFEVYEDEVLQDIQSMVLTHGGRTINLLQPPPPPPEEGIILPPPRPTSDTSGRIFLLFVDDLHLDFRNTARIRGLFDKISKTLIHEGDMFGIVSTGPSSLAIDLTYDRGLLEAAIKRISGAGLHPSDIIETPTGAQGPSEVRYRAHVAFSTAYDILRNLAKVHNRRKAFIYVSNGYDFNPFPQGRYNNPYFGGNVGIGEGEEGGSRRPNPFEVNSQGAQFADADLVRELAELTRTANRANATIYTIDPRGLVGGPDIGEDVDPVEWYNYVQKSIDSLRVIAEETGGIAVVNQNDFDKALKRIDAETSDYYILGYYSSNPDPTQRTRRIEVKVKRPDLDVWSRTSYTLELPPEPVSSAR